MGQAEGGSARLGARAVAGLAALLAASLPVWAGRLEAWRSCWAAAVVLLLAAVWGGGRPLRMPRCAWPLAGAVGLGALALWPSVVGAASVRYVLFWLAALVSLVLGYEMGRAGQGVLLLGGVALGAAVCGVWGLREYLVTALLLGDRSWRPFGPFANPNALGGYLAVATPALAVAAVHLGRQAAEAKPGNPVRIAWPVALVLSVIAVGALLATASKGALLACVAGLLVMAGLGARSRWVLLGAVVAVLAIVGWPSTRARLVAAFSTQRASSFAFRLLTWKGTWAMARARPWLGWGPGSFAHAYPCFALVPFTAMAHCSWLQMAAENGFPAAVALVAGLGWCMVAAARRKQGGPAARPAQPPGEERGRRGAGLKAQRGMASCRLAKGPPMPQASVRLAGTFALTVLVTHNLVDYTWYFPAIAFTALLLGGLGASEGWGERGEERPARVFLLLGMAASLVAAVGAGMAGYQDWRRGQAVAAAEAGRYEAAISALRAALRWGPFGQGDIWLDLGKVYEGRAGEPPEAGWLEKAAQAYVEALRWAPTEPAASLGAARCYRRRAQLDRALYYAQWAAGVYPAGPAALLEKARVLEALGRQKEALAVYRQMLCLAEGDYGRYSPLEGWADYHLAFAGAAVARAATSPAERHHAWQITGRILAAYLRWAAGYRQAAAPGGAADLPLFAELRSLASEAAAFLARTGEVGDRVLARKLREIAQR
jgi:O-antigen ligase